MNGLVEQQELLAYTLSGKFTNLLAGAALQTLLHMSPAPPVNAFYAGAGAGASTTAEDKVCGWSISGADRLSILQEHALLLDIPLGDGAGEFTKDINIHLKLPLPILSQRYRAEIEAQQQAFAQAKPGAQVKQSRVGAACATACAIGSGASCVRCIMCVHCVFWVLTAFLLLLLPFFPADAIPCNIQTQRTRQQPSRTSAVP